MDRVLNKDPFNSQCLPLHIAVLVELKKANSKEHSWTFSDWPINPFLKFSLLNIFIFHSTKYLFSSWAIIIIYLSSSISALFFLAHKLVDLYPTKAVSMVYCLNEKKKYTKFCLQLLVPGSLLWLWPIGFNS